MAAKAATRQPRKSLLVLAAASLAMGVPGALGQTNSAPGCATLQNQTVTARVPSLEVASIKPNKTGNGRWRLQSTSDGVTAMGVTIRMLLKEAYGIYEDGRIAGTQTLLDSERFDIEAKVDSADAAEFQNLNYLQRMSLLQPLLAERFKLVVHRQDKEMPIYALTLAKKGARLENSKSDCTHRLPTVLRGRSGAMTVECFTMAALSQDLSLNSSVGRHVLDKTGLTGFYDFKLDWAPDSGVSPPANGSNGASTSPDSSGPSIFTALQEQLGLKLESQKGPVEILVIDHVEMPSEN